MSDLRDLYQELILDHNRRPHHFGVPAEFDRQAEGHNPLCGDQVTVYLDIEGDIVTNVQFMGAGCAISVASASMMTDAVRGKTVAEAEALFDRFRQTMTGEGDSGPITGEASELDALSGVREFPVRIKCATLPWHTLAAALHGENRVSTEGSD